MAAILADDILKCIFLNENDRTSIQISLKFRQAITRTNDDPILWRIYALIYSYLVSSAGVSRIR